MVVAIKKELNANNMFQRLRNHSVQIVDFATTVAVADGTSGTGNGNGHSGGVALNGGHTDQGCIDAIGKCV